MVLRSVCRPLAVAVLCVTATVAAAQTKPLTVEEIYGYEGWKRFNGSQAAMMTWVPAGDPWISDTRSPVARAERVEGPGQAAAERTVAARRCPVRREPAALYLRAARARARRRRRSACRRAHRVPTPAFDLRCRARRLSHHDWRRPVRLQTSRRRQRPG